MAKREYKHTPIPALALLLAWVVPGAGHLYIGRRTRGIVIFATLGIMFWAGIALGGVMTVDRAGEPWWFAADMLTGAHGLAAWQVHKAKFNQMKAAIEIAPAFTKSARDLDDGILKAQQEFRQAQEARRKAPKDSTLQDRSNQRYTVLAQLAGRREQLFNSFLQEELARQKLALTAPLDTVARAYSGVAGLLNLLCMFDVLMLSMMGRIGEPPRPEPQEAP